MAAEPTDTGTLAQMDFGIADCPYCDGTLYFPVTAWVEAGYYEYGRSDWNADYDNPRCAYNCMLTHDDIQSVEIYDHITTDVGEDGWPIDMDQGEPPEGT